MENNQKWVNLSFMSGAALVGFILFLLVNKGAAALDFEGRVQHLGAILKVVSLVAGSVVFLILYRNKVANSFMDEVFTELGKVTWPAREETFKGTIAVIIAVTIMGFMFGFVDWVWSHLVNYIL